MFMPERLNISYLQEGLCPMALACGTQISGVTAASPSLQTGQSTTGKNSLFSKRDLNLGVSGPFAAPLCSETTCSSNSPAATPTKPYRLQKCQRVASAQHLPTADAHSAVENRNLAACLLPCQPLLSTHIQCWGTNMHIPQVPTALSTPEGLPWITRSPWKAQLLINISSSSVHLKSKKITPIHKQNQNLLSDRAKHQRPQEMEEQRELHKAPSCCGMPSTLDSLSALHSWHFSAQQHMETHPDTEENWCCPTETAPRAQVVPRTPAAEQWGGREQIQGEDPHSDLVEIKFN